MRYSQKYNEKNGQRGHVWQARYYSCVMDEAHLAMAMRYVEQNPVKAGMINNPWEYQWSSAREHCDEGADSLVTLSHAEGMLDMRGWKEYLCEYSIIEEQLIENMTKKGAVLADEEFMIEIGEKIGRTITNRDKGRPRKKKGTEPFF